MAETGCQVPSPQARPVGNSGVRPPQYDESRFVADDAPGTLDEEWPISQPGQTVLLCIETTRYVGAVDGEGFLRHAQQHIDEGTLAPAMVLTIRARISSVESGGTLGDGRLDVEVVIHRNSDLEFSLGHLVGDYGSGSADWQDFELDVPVSRLRWPVDPGPRGHPNLAAPQMVGAANELTLVLTGTSFPAVVEVDWLMLEPKDAPGLAARPVLLLHGLDSSSASMAPGTAWADGLAVRDIGTYAPDLTPRGSIVDNGREITAAVADMKRRFGVEAVQVMGHSKGGIDARDHVANHDDVETLIMLGAPNNGSFLADAMQLLVPKFGTIFEYLKGSWFMSGACMRPYNRVVQGNPATTYVTAAGDHSGDYADRLAMVVGPNDMVVAVDSVEILPYAEAWTYFSADRFTGHIGLRFNTRIVNELFPRYLAVLTPPPSRRTQRRRAVRARDLGGPAVGFQGVYAAAGTGAAGVTVAHPAMVDTADLAVFLLFGDQAALSIALVAPDGTRTEPTSETAAVGYISYLDDGLMSCTGFVADAPAAGVWTLEVTGAADTAYGVVTLVPMAPGGITLTAAVDRDLYAAGEQVTFTATVTSGDAPILDATVTAAAIHPDGVSATAVPLTPVGNGYAGEFTVNLAGQYTIAVTAAGAAPAFARELVVDVIVARSAAALTGSVVDRGVDGDGDGRFDELVVDVEVEIDIAGLYRLSGTLTGDTGTAIELARAEHQMEPGNHTLPLPFDGAVVFKSGADGPYRVERIRLEEADTGLTLDLIESYTTAAYAHTDFVRPLCLLTGQAADHGESTTGSPPYAKLVVEIEVDSLVEAPVRAQAKLYATDGTFIGGSWIFVNLSPGLTMVAFEFDDAIIFRAGHAGSYTLRLLTLWGTANGGAPVSLRVADPVAVTRPYALGDFAPPSTHTVGGTVTGLIGTGLTLTDKAVFVDLHPGNGAFAFTLPRTAGSRYDVQVTRHPAGPVQVCTIANGAGVVGATDVTDIEVHCATPVPQDGLDPTFGGGKVTAAHSAPTGMALQGDGRILVVGGRTLARYLPDGAPDPTFGVGGIVTVSFGTSPLATATAVAVAHDGRILVAGYIPLGTDDLALARYTDTGAPDTSFGTGGLVTTDFHGGTDQAWSVLVQPDHKIVLVGSASTGPPVPASDFAAARYLDTGEPDSDFGDGGKVMTDIAGGSDLACAAVLQPDGKIVAIGRVATSGGTDPDFGLVRYTVDGVPDPDFGTAGVVRTDFGVAGWVQPTDLALTGNGEIVVVGQVRTSRAVFAVARFDHTGRPDPAFGDGGLVTTPIGTGDAVANAVAVQADGTLVVAGYASSGGPADFTVVRYAAGGVSSSTVTVDFYGGEDRADCIAIQPDGGIVVAGSAVNVRTTGLGMARLLA